MLTRAQLQNPKQLVKLIVTALLLALCLWLGVAIGLQFAQSPLEPATISRISTTPPPSWDWFGGEPMEVIADSEEIAEELANASINAQLLGVLLAGEASTATIKVGGSPEAVYQKGDDLASNAVIVDIQPYRIVVSQNGVNKQVLMKKPDMVIETEDYSYEAEAQPDNGFALANMFGAVPVMASGSTGFKMNNLSDEMKQLADIQEGDVVTQVNGIAIQDIMADPAQWMQFSTSTSLPVTVIRQGQEEVIYVNAASLSAKMLPSLGLNP
jgi:type II secretion system protein C